MPIDLRPQSSTAMVPLLEMIVASTVSAGSKPGASFVWNASLKMYEPAWISV